MSKQKRYFNELKALINAEITLYNLNADTMRRVIVKTLDWSRSHSLYALINSRTAIITAFHIVPTSVNKFDFSMRD